jgi:hypothetical protein
LETPRLRAGLPLSVSLDVPPLLGQRVVALLESFGLQVRVTPLSPEGVRESRSGARLLLFLPEVAEPTLVGTEIRSLAGLPPRRPDGAGAAGDDALAIPLLRMPVRFGVRRGVHGAAIDAAGRLVLEDAWLEP